MILKQLLSSYHRSSIIRHPSVNRQLSTIPPTFVHFMPLQKKTKLRSILKWVLWVFVVQLILVNISAAIYAYKFTHFYDKPAPAISSLNVFDKTWKLFVGPKYYKMSEETEPNFPYQTVSLKTSDDIPIDGWYSTVDSAKGCVIFFHGISVNKTFLRNEASKFRQFGYNVLMIDFRAHGKSGGHTSTFGVKETDEVQKAFEFASAKGNKRVILYGVSLGAGVCIKAVAENRVRPAAIIADMPFGTMHNHLRSRAKALGFPSEPFASLVTLWIGIERGYNGFSHNIAAYAKNVKCPVLVEWGDKDSYVKFEEVKKVYLNLASSKKKFIVYPNAEHESFFQVDAARWEIEMKTFLNSLQ